MIEFIYEISYGDGRLEPDQRTAAVESMTDAKRLVEAWNGRSIRNKMMFRYRFVKLSMHLTNDQLARGTYSHDEFNIKRCLGYKSLSL